MLDWFGGEPILQFNEVVYPISKYIKDKCAEHKISFLNTVTSNGLLFDDDMINKLNEIKLNRFQITLDGWETSHNKVKKDKEIKNPYRHTINNILKIIDNVDDLDLMLRINYTKQNINELTKIIDDIPKNYRDKIEISMQQVWQTQDDVVEVEEINNIFVESGFIAPLYKLEGKYYKCYADLDAQLVISPDGKVFKCTARDFANHKPDGILNKEGNIEWKEEYYKRMSKTTIENENCMNCKLLPACWGPCSQKLIEDNDFEQICNKEGIENTIKFVLNDFYKNNIEK